MNGWMRRRIERSRARCDRAATNHKADKERGAEAQPKLAAVTPQGDNTKGT